MSKVNSQTGVQRINPPALLYRLLSPLILIFWVFHAIVHGFKYKEWRYLPQRLGFSSTCRKNTIWLHASSVGEVNLIKPLCEQLIANNHSLTITTFTASGLQRANTLFASQADIMCIPIDCWPISWFFAQRLKPKCSLIAETELWPETLYQFAKLNTPLIQINARLSNKSLHAPKVVYSLLAQTLSYFTVHLTRYNEDIQNFIAMGVNANKIQVMGNLKSAQSLQTHRHDNLIKQPYLLFASTHEGEETSFCSFLLNKQLDFPLLVIAPRHPNRLDQILKSLLDLGLSKSDIAVRSRNEAIQPHTKLYLADTFGELTSLYYHAQIVIMGGSFTDIGGHNVLEPAALGACIITGPSDANIKHDISALKQHSAIIQVSNIDELATQISHFLSHQDAQIQQGKNAEAFVKNTQEVLTIYTSKIEDYLNIKSI